MRPANKLPTLLMTCALISIGSCTGSSEREQLPARFRDYMDAWKRRDFDTVWRIMSPELRSANKSEEKYVDYVKTQGIYPSDYAIRSVTATGNIGVVIADVSYANGKGAGLGKEREACQFISDKGRWYFDDCKPALSKDEAG